MYIKVNGVKAWIGILIVLAIIMAIIILLFKLVMFLLPVILIVIVVSYLFRMLNKVKKGKPKDYIDINFKIKK
jgi:hypothetical protein